MSGRLRVRYQSARDIVGALADGPSSHWAHVLSHESGRVPSGNTCFRCGAFLLFFEASAFESAVRGLDLVALATVGPQSSSNQCTTFVSNETKARSCRSCVCVLRAAGLSD